MLFGGHTGWLVALLESTVPFSPILPLLDMKHVEHVSHCTTPPLLASDQRQSVHEPLLSLRNLIQVRK